MLQEHLRLSQQAREGRAAAASPPCQRPQQLNAGLCPECGHRTGQDPCERCGSRMTEALEAWRTAGVVPAARASRHAPAAALDDLLASADTNAAVDALTAALSAASMPQAEQLPDGPPMSPAGASATPPELIAMLSSERLRDDAGDECQVHAAALLPAAVARRLRRVRACQEAARGGHRRRVRCARRPGLLSARRRGAGVPRGPAGGGGGHHAALLPRLSPSVHRQVARAAALVPRVQGRPELARSGGACSFS